MQGRSGRKAKTKVTSEMALLVRRLREDGLSYTKIAAAVGIVEATVYRIVSNPNWGVTKPKPSLKDRFYDKVICTPGCWKWMAAKHRMGYGKICMVTNGKKKVITASRASWIIHNGEIPSGMHVLHRCDNPECTNPEHLFLGSNLDNIKDRVKKGRSWNGDRRGQRNGHAKLTDEQVLLIRSDERGPTAIARDYGMSKSMIKYIKSGRYWAHLCVP